MAKTVVQLVTEQGTPLSLLIYIVFFTLGIMFLHFFNNIANNKREKAVMIADDRFYMMYQERYMQVDYEWLENPEFQINAERAKRSIQNGRILGMMECVTGLFSAILGLITYAIILFPLSPWMIVMMAGVSTIGYFIYGYNHKWSRIHRSEWTPVYKRIWYNIEKIRDAKSAKDIRIYQMLPWIRRRFKQSEKEVNETVRYIEFRWKVIDTIFALLTMVRDFLAYGTLVYRVYNGSMSAAEFVLYFNALMMFVRWLLQFYEKIDGARFSSYEICDFRDYMNAENDCTEGGNRPVPEETCEIRFENVEYKYPGSEIPALSGADFTIAKGEKIAIVGPNGAGKTTLVKLLCGLYQPTGGRVLAGGYDIREYNKKEYFKMLACVFQDIVFLPKTIEENITLCPEGEEDADKLEKAIQLSGLKDKLERLSDGSKTFLVKEVREGAISLSGGEAQKLALARALYKNEEILVLDEPTAALDPIAESEIYQKYNELSKEKTSLFISHRLASTRFCDRIFYIEGGRISEMGTHEELMRLGGKYAEMFHIQSQYYTENVEGGAGNE